jgi:DNA uptake protein ComE-like DNA-binding protein
MRRAIAFSRLSSAVAVALILCCSAALAQKKSPPAKALDLNSASAEQLQLVPGIGPKTAAAIVDFRFEERAVPARGRFACDQRDQQAEA